MPSLEFDNLEVCTGDKPVVHDVTLSVPSGEIVVVFGKNGSGKSTLVNGVMGHPNFQLTRGTIRLNGRDITRLRPEEKARAGLFLSLQHIPKIGGVTLASFIHKAYEALHCREVAALEFYLLLKDIAAEFALDARLLDRPLIAGLSGGERKQSEALQLAALRPTYALLDEIDSGVDIEALTNVFSALQRLAKQGIGILLITHDITIVNRLLITKLHILSDGRITQSGGPELTEQIAKYGFARTEKQAILV